MIATKAVNPKNDKNSVIGCWLYCNFDKQIFKIYFLYRIVDIILKKITPSIDEVIF